MTVSLDFMISTRELLIQCLITAAQTSYLLYASDNNQNFKITRLDANYYNVTTTVNTLSGLSPNNISTPL